MREIGVKLSVKVCFCKDFAPNFVLNWIIIRIFEPNFIFGFIWSGGLGQILNKNTKNEAIYILNGQQML